MMQQRTQDSALPQMNRGKYTIKSLAKFTQCATIQARQISKALIFTDDSSDVRFFQEFYNTRFTQFYYTLNPAGNDYAQLWGGMACSGTLTKIL